MAQHRCAVLVAVLLAGVAARAGAGSDGLFCGPTLAPLTAIPDQKASFAHPGVLVSGDMLAALRQHYLSGTAPWCTWAPGTQKSAGNTSAAPPQPECVDGWIHAVNTSHFLDPKYAPQPRALVECGSYDKPAFGCSEERSDAAAAYANAVLWAITQDKGYAHKAVEILDAWTILQNHTNENAQLQAGMAGSPFIRAAEIMVHTWDGWPQDRVAAFKAMLVRAFLPLLSGGCLGFNGNWELILTEATMSMAVFFDSQELFNRSLTLWRARVPAYLYLSSDGATPRPPLNSGWSPQTVEGHWKQTPRGPGPWPQFHDGLCQETCRDMGHVQMGLSAMMDGAETAYHQGVMLFDEEAARIQTGLEFHAALLCRQRASHDRGCDPGNTPTPPSWLCGGNYTLTYKPSEMWEVSYNHFHHRRGQALPRVKTILNITRPTDVVLYMVFETLTHGQPF